MKKLKAIRKKYNMTQKDMAERLNISQQTVAKWESGKIEPSLKHLREIALLFSTGVDDLLDNSNRITTNELGYFPKPKNNKDLYVDGFWGNIGIRLKSHKTTRWYPISEDAYNAAFGSIQSEGTWFTVETLNNKMLFINRKSIVKITLLDEADDPTEDWILEWDSYSGESPEFYKALEEYFYDYNEKNIPEHLLKDIKNTIQEGKISDQDIMNATINARIFLNDGSVESKYIYECKELTECIESCIYDLEGELTPAVICIETGAEECFYNADEVSLVEIPLIKYKQALSEITGKFGKDSPLGFDPKESNKCK